MQKVPPPSNNPNNPLNKVATLTIDREDWKDNKARVRTSLQFNLCHEMRGDARDQRGEPVIISFALAINKAALELRWEFDEPAGKAKIRASKVAHRHALAAKQTVKTSKEDLSKKVRSASANVKGSVGASAKGVSASIKAGVQAAVDRTRKRTDKTNTKVEYEVPNVLATIDGSVIHWSIRPHDFTEKPNLANPATYLYGEVFMEEDGQEIVACVLTRAGAKKYPSLNLQGVVKINSRDLMIDGVVFQDALGNELDWRQLDKAVVADARPTPMEHLLGFGSSIKARIMQQIIKKRLVDRGLMSDGRDVEICSARG